MKSLTSMLLLPALAITLVGCSSAASEADADLAAGDQDVAYASIRKDLTPELKGTTETHLDVDRNFWTAQNTTVRQISDDWGRVFYTDHPSRLSPLPIVYTSGRPR